MQNKPIKIVEIFEKNINLNLSRIKSLLNQQDYSKGFDQDTNCHKISSIKH